MIPLAHGAPPASRTLSGTFAPKWTLRTVILSSCITLGLYILLPYLETLSAPPEKDTSLRNMDTTTLSAPPPPLSRPKPRPRPNSEPPKPKLEQPRQQLSPLAATMNLEMALGDVAADFSMSYRVTDADLSQQIENMIFEIGDLDEPPRPLARLTPVYPARARMRRIEGYATVEFIVAPDGTVRDPVVTQSEPGDIFNDAALRAVSRWKFQPGSKDNLPVSTRVRQRVNFTLQ